MVTLAGFLGSGLAASAAQSITLIWNPSPDTNVTGYYVYYGGASRSYTNRVDVGANTNALINGLLEGRTYYFAATAYNILGMESDYSAEVSYTVPGTGNAAPTLNAIANLSITEDAAPQPVNLSGISSGGEAQTLTVVAASSNPALIPNPTVNYTPGSSTGSLTLTPVPNAHGSATISVMVNDGAASNNLVTRTFTVTVSPVNDAPTLNAIANLTVNEDAATQTVALTGISAGPNESQPLVVTATSSNPNVVPNPTVNYASPGSSGTLTFAPRPNAYGSVTITVTVNDGSGANNLVTRTFTVAVNSVNDAPRLNPISNLTLNETPGPQTVALSGISTGATNELQTLVITASSSNPALIPNPTVSYATPAATGSISFTPVPDASGQATISVTIRDGGNANHTTIRTFTVTVNPVNDAPTLNAIANLAINEDSDAQIVTLQGISSGATNESQTLIVAATSSNPALIPNPTVAYSSPGSSGTLTLTPAANASGSAVITVTVNDGAPANNLVTRTFNVVVSPVNDAPTLNAIANLTLNENPGLQTVALSGISSGAANESQTLVVTATSSNPALIPHPVVTYSSPSATGSIAFTPVNDASGVVSITVTVNDGSASNNIVTRTFNVAINDVNNAPTLDPIANVTINEDAALQTVTLAGISSGAPNEAQVLSISATSSNPALIPNPTVVYSNPNSGGSLTFAPLSDASGSAVITVVVNDGAAANNQVARSFTVTVNPVNDAPTLDAVASLAIAQNAGSQTVNLSGITSGATNEAQTLSVTAVSSNPGLIPNPAVSYSSPNTSGTLTLAPVPSVSGTATITVTVNDGGAANTTISRTFVVTVTSMNQPPTLNPLPDIVVARNAGVQTVDLQGISSGSISENQTLSVSAISSDTSIIPHPTVVYTSPSTGGRITFAPVTSASGSALITVTVNDNAASNNIIQRAFTVTVNSAPTFSSIPNQTIGVNSNTGPINFIVSDRETPAANLTLTGWSSAPGLVPTNNIVFGGSGADRTVRVTPAANQTGSAVITLELSDGISIGTATFQVTVLGQPAAPQTIMVVTNGAGTVSGLTRGNTMAVGKSYTLTAVPAAGQEFAGWSGSIKSSAATIKFTAKSNMVLQANFVPTPFKLGTYNGLLYEDDEIQVATSGKFSLLVTRGGRYTGKVTLAARQYPVSGKFSLDCRATNTIKRVGAAPMVLTWQLATGDGDQVSGLLTGASTSVLRGDRVVFNRTNTSPFAGNYTLVLPGSDTADLFEPAGHGYGTFNVSSLGVAKFSGVLADGTKVSQSATISKNGDWPFYLSLSAGRGTLISWLAFTNRAEDDVNGAMTWLRNPNPRARLYRAGIDRDTLAVGSRVLSTPGTNLLNSAFAEVAFSGGNLVTSFENVIQVSTNNRAANLSTNYLTIGISSVKGTFVGKVKVPGTTKPKTFAGVVLQKAGRGYGFMAGTSQTSAVDIRAD